MTTDSYEVFAIKYGEREGTRGGVFIRGDPHDEPLRMDYFIWLIRNDSRTIVVDLGFEKAEGERRGRTWFRNPADAVRLLGTNPADVHDVIITHMHYDHAGNSGDFPNARFHLQDQEMDYITGRAMTHPVLRHSYALPDVLEMIRMLYGDRVVFHAGDEPLCEGIELYHVPGHTRGLQCVRVATERGKVVLASDTSHYYENLEHELPFATLENMYAMLEGYRKVKSLAAGMTHIVPGHDPAVLQRYPAPSADLQGIVACLHRAPTE